MTWWMYLIIGLAIGLAILGALLWLAPEDIGGRYSGEKDQ